MKSQSTKPRLSQPRLTLALGLSDGASRTYNPRNTGWAIELEKKRSLPIGCLEGFAERERLLCLRQGIPRHSVWVKRIRAIG